MKITRKGFTLVELLIVVAILATLSASMTVAVTGSTSKAKASTIAANVDACKTAVTMYLAANEDMSGADVSESAENVIKAYIGTWEDFNRDKTKYTAEGSKSTEWVLKVDFSAEPDHEAIATALEKIKGFGKYGATGENAKSVVNSGKFKVTLINGKVEADS